MSEHTVAATDAGGRGYHKDLKKRRINVIAIGGAIGTGLILGTGDCLHRVDPALIFVYAICGVFVSAMRPNCAARRPRFNVKILTNQGWPPMI
jgi:L-asparagine transporter-like permease